MGFAIVSVAQENNATDSIFYYYKGSKLYLPLNRENIVVYFNVLDTLNEDEIFDSMKIVENVMCGDLSRPNQKRLLINIGQNDYENAVKTLQNDIGVIDVEPVIGIDKIRKVSRRFYVKLKNENDYSKLDSASILNRVTILGEVPSCENWYELEVSNLSIGNSITVANTFWETGLFADIDPGFLFDFQNNLEYCVTDSSFNEQWGPLLIHACEAWNLTTGTPSVKVAVIDQGVDVQHRELNHVNVYYSYDEITNSAPAHLYYNTTYFGQNIYHGTHVGGIIFSNHNSNQIAGISPNASLINISHNLKGGGDDQIAKLATAIAHAVLQGAHVINNSWGDQGGNVQNMHSALIEDYIDIAINNNCLVVFAAGNHSPSMDYPATYRDEILAVGSMDQYYFRSSFSAFGTHLDIVAPGSSIYSTNHDNSFLYLDGTSMAAPHISGVAALMLSVNSNLTALDISNIIGQTAEKVGSYSYNPSLTHPNGTWNQEMGYGLVDAHKAVVYAMEYGHGYIIGPENLSGCGIGTYSCDFSHPDIFTYTWTTTSNLSITSNNGSSITVMPSSSGTGTLTVEVRQQGRLMYTLTKTINVSSVWTGITPVATAPFHITSSTTWSSETFLPVTAIVDQDATLTVTDDVLCGTYARIVVRPGGKLVVDGGTLTSACTGEMWQGIFVEGHSNLHQTAANQGKVVLRNGAVIENAMCGIRTSTPGDESNTSTGGIIIAENATFHNCARGVDMKPYTDYNPATGLLKPNASSFTRCTFALDPNHHFASCGARFLNHARLWGVNGVCFIGCTFNNTTSDDSHGYGIYAEDAGFTVDTYCSQPIMNSDCSCVGTYATYSTFSGFVTAINVSTSGSPFAVIVNEASFANNCKGVSVGGNNLATVTRCQFDLSTSPEIPYSATGLELSACTGFLVEGNAFSRTSSTFPTYGIKVAGAGIPNNSLYRNTFSGLTYGIHASGDNGGGFSGLRFSCNTFSQNAHDIYVANGDVAESQGSASKGADNSFSSSATGNFEVMNPKFRLDYYYSTGGSHCPTVHTSNVLLHSNASANGCASTLCTGGGPIRGLPEYNALSVAMNTASAVCQNADDTANRASLLQEMSDIASDNIRGIIGSDTLDVNALKDWFSAVDETWSKYSLAETEYLSGESNAMTLQGVSALLETEEERDEYDNYMAFNALKEALSGHLHGHADWPSSTGTQIAELQRIADANTGRSSVMARGVLCFFFGICEDEDFTVMGDPRHLAATGENDISSHHQDVSMKLYPNPATNTLHVEFEGLDDPQGTLTVTNITGVAVLTRECNSPVTQLDVSNLAPGLYVVSFRNGKGVMVKKFVKL